ncbi:MAG: D-aminoacyl-tRNA deacylase [Bacillota bacterium]
MRTVVQRVSKGSVQVADEIVGQIQNGLVVYLGVGKGDDERDAEYLAEKIVNLRIFEDEKAKMNLSILDTDGEILVVSQFTLYGDCRKGRRPSFIESAPPEEGERLFNYFIEILRLRWKIKIETGIFRENMQVASVNEGPVTILLDSKKQF